VAYRNAEETMSYYKQHMGTKLGTAFYAIVADVQLLHAKWGDYVELFGVKPSRIDLLNQVAPDVFARFQDTLFNDVLLHVARLVDPPTSCGKPNLSLKHVAMLVVDADAKCRIEPLVADMEEKARFCRDWRNRRLAHADFALAIGDPVSPLAPATRYAVKEAIAAIAVLLNETSAYYCNSSLHFRCPESYGALGLLYVLDDGLRAEAERQERIKHRNYRQDDISPRDL
jgi:hypothetical protein